MDPLGKPLGMNLSHPTISNGKTNAATGPAVPRNFRHVQSPWIVSSNVVAAGPAPVLKGRDRGRDPRSGVIVGGGLWGDCYLYHGPPQPSFLRVITHILGVVKPSFFMVLGSKGSWWLVEPPITHPEKWRSDPSYREFWVMDLLFFVYEYLGVSEK